MAKKFVQKVPKKPILRKKTYKIPSSYTNVYGKCGITNSDEQIILFHLTQFGGFRLKKNHINTEFIGEWCKADHDAGYYQFRANQNFLAKFGRIKIQPLEKIWRNDPLNYLEMKECGYSDDEINESMEFLTKLNRFYSDLKLNISPPHSGITAKDRVQLSRFHGIPYLVKKPKAGGRFFNPETSYQRISSALRQMITINGRKTSEIDISASTLQFLNISIEKYASASLMDAVLSKRDPYEYFLSRLNSDEFLSQHREQPIDRESVKTLVYTIIYSLNANQETNVNQKLKAMERQYKHSDFVQLFPEFFSALSTIKKDDPLHMVIFREESRYAKEILQTGCLEYNIPILPIHDSFMTTTKNLSNLERIMDITSEKLYGRHLLYKQKY